jgi:hypothetical protein
MIQSGEQIQTPRIAAHPGTPRVSARVTAWVTAAQSIASSLWTEIVVGSPDLARIGLISLALAAQTIVLYSPGHFRPAPNALFAAMATLGTLSSLGLALVASLPLKRFTGLTVRQLLAATALVALIGLSVVGVRVGLDGIWSLSHGVPYTNDGAVMDLHSARLVLRGHNPYVKTNIIPALADINAPCQTVTPLMDGQFRGARAYPSDAAINQACLNDLHYRARPGVPTPPEFESKYNYPAGSFLFILPFLWAGIHDMRFLYALAALGIGAYLWARMPRLLRLFVPLLLLADVPIITHLVGGQPDTIYGILLLIGYAEWRRPWTSPLAMGLAVATRQMAWFFVPFYLIVVTREFGLREAVRRTSLIALTFLALNAPFIVQSPASYVSSVMGPMTDPMFPLGVGIIALFVSNVVPMLPKLAFTLAELAAWTGSVFAFARFRLLTPASGVMLAGLPLFFAWRSLITYFYLVPLLALAVTMAESTSRPAEQTAT